MRARTTNARAAPLKPRPEEKVLKCKKGEERGQVLTCKEQKPLSTLVAGDGSL